MVNKKTTKQYLEDKQDFRTLFEQDDEKEGFKDLNVLLHEILVPAIEQSIELKKGDPENGVRPMQEIPGRRKLRDNFDDQAQVTLKRVPANTTPEDLQSIPGGTLKFQLSPISPDSVDVIVSEGMSDVLVNTSIEDVGKQELIKQLTELFERKVDAQEHLIGEFGIV